MELGIGLRAGEVVLDYRILRPFLVQLNRAWKARGKWMEQELGKLAASVRDDVLDIPGHSSPSVVGGGPGPDTIPLYRRPWRPQRSGRWSRPPAPSPAYHRRNSLCGGQLFGPALRRVQECP